MRPSTLRTALVAATTGVLLTGLAASAATKPKLPTCGSWTDAAGDSSLQGPVGAEPALDITKVTYKSDGKAFTAAIDVPGFKQQPTFAVGNRFEVQMTIAGHVTYLYYNDSTTRAQQENAFYQAGVYVDGTRVAGSETLVTRSSSGTQQIVSIPLADLAGAVGVKAADLKSATLGEVRARGNYPGANSTFDTATAPESLALPLTACS